MKTLLFSCILTLLAAFQASAVTVNWTDWTSASTSTSPNSASGNLLFGSNNVSVSYTGQIFFAITDVGTNYWTEPNVASRPYTSGEVTNAPPASDIIAMSLAATRTLTFSEAVTDLYFAYVSMNGNGFTFDRDFDLVSNGTGFFGTGPVQKVDNGNGTFSLNAVSGEPHGIIKLRGSFTSVTWTSAANETWYGFTVGAAARTADLPSDVPEPATFALAGLALAGVVLARKR
jgi:hypothetical protein